MTITVERLARHRINWTPELVAELNARYQAGATLAALTEEYGISKQALLDHLKRLPPGKTRPGVRGPSPNIVVTRSAPAVPPHMGRPALPCGCRRGEPCERAQALKLAYEAETFGSRTWATKRQEWVKHVSGEAARQEASSE